MSKQTNNEYCGIALGYHAEEDVTEFCGRRAVTGICGEHWDEHHALSPAVARLSEENARLIKEVGVKAEYIGDVDSNVRWLKKEQERLTADLAEAMDMLTEVEWGYHDNFQNDQCPFCGAKDTRGHEADCRLNNLLQRYMSDR